MKKIKINKWISLLMAIIMMTQFVPFGAFAEEMESAEPEVIQETVIAEEIPAPEIIQEPVQETKAEPAVQEVPTDIPAEVSAEAPAEAPAQEPVIEEAPAEEAVKEDIIEIAPAEEVKEETAAEETPVISEEIASAEEFKEEASVISQEAEVAEEEIAEEASPEAEEITAEETAVVFEDEISEEESAEEIASEDEIDEELIDEESEEESEEEIEEELEAEEDEEEEILYPAFSFSGSTGSMTVIINAPEGALPEGTTVRLFPVSAAAVEGTVKALAGNGMEVIEAVDITFFDKDGNEIEPNCDISVTFVSSEIAKGEDIGIVHIADSGASEMISSSVSGSAASFSSDSFSTYVAVKAAASPTLKLTFNFLQWNENGEYAVVKTYTRSVSSGGTTTQFTLTTVKGYITVKSATVDGIAYKFADSFIYEDGSDVVFPLKLTYAEAAAICGEATTATVNVYAKYVPVRADVTYTINVSDIRQANGTVKTAVKTGTLSDGDGSGVSKTTFQSLTGLRPNTSSFSYTGYKYTYTGDWVFEDGTPVDFSSTIWFYNKEGEDGNNKYYLDEDLVWNIKPVWEQTMIQGLDYFYIDNISTGSGSWSNADAFAYRSEFGSLTHTFKDPSDYTPAPHYRFLYWQNDDSGEQFEKGDSFTYYVNSGLPAGTVTTVTMHAVWQPSVTVNYYVDGSLEDKTMDTLVNTVENFDSIAVYDFVPEYEGARFLGWYDEDGNLLSEDAVFSAPEITTEKVEQYIENIYARFETDYTIEHLLQQIDGEFVLNEDATDELTGIIGETVTAEPKEFEGHTFDEAIDGTIKEDKLHIGTVLKLYYTRNSYTVTYVYEGSVIPAGAEDMIPNEATYLFEAEVPAAKIPAVAGYTFSGWNGEVSQMPANDVIVTGSWSANTDTAYKVEHYTENLDGSFTLANTDNNIGTTDTEVTAKERSYEGFALDRSVEGTVEKGIVAGDGSLVLKLYYTRNTYKVTYVYTGSVPSGAPTVPAEATYRFGETVTAAGAVSMDGYTFSGWSREGTFEMPAEDVEINGSFTEIIPEPTSDPEPASEDPAPAPAPAPVVPTFRPAPAQPTEPDPEPTPVEVIDNPTPQAPVTPAEPQVIVDPEPPVAPPAQRSAWALINLLSAIATCLVGAGMIITFFKKKDDEDEEEENKEKAASSNEEEDEDDENKRKKSKFFGLIPAITSVIAFILTENMRNPMVLTDKWTIMMIIILLVNAVLAFLTRNKKDDEEEEEEKANA